jgi:predicted membrane protein
MSGRSVFALVLISIGVLLFLDYSFEGFSFGYLLSFFWPTLLIAIGSLMLLRASRPSFGALILLLLGVYFLTKKLGYLPENSAGIFIAGGLVFVGIWLILMQKDYQKTNQTTRDTINSFALMSGTQTRIQSKQFKGGSVFAFMGGVEIDLSNVTLDEKGAYLECTAIMGGIEIRVPATCILDISSLPLLGACEDHTKAENSHVLSGPVLKIHCTAIMGGVELKN